MATSDNIPIIFVPGTSGTSLDRDNSSTPLNSQFAGDVHTFPEVCVTCPLGVATHGSQTFNYNPGSVDPDGPRVWIGPEAVGNLVADTVNANLGNHYLDILQFDDLGGNTIAPEIGPGTVLGRVNLLPAGVVNKPIYAPLLDFLSNAPPNGLGRTICSDLSCSDPQHNGVYLFPYDWRLDLQTQTDSLATFVDQVRSRTPMHKVVLMGHSLGGLMCRAYYLSPQYNGDQKVEQVITLSGGFGGSAQPLKILVMGDTWGFGLGYGSVTVGVAEWETQALAQNWPTAYFQMPNADVWFFDDTHRSAGSYDRSYIRDQRQPTATLSNVPDVPLTYQDSLTWIDENHNAIINDQAASFFTEIAVGDFQVGTTTIPHHRIIGKGRTDTVVAVRLYTGHSDAYDLAIATGIAATPAESVPVTRYKPVHGDGDSTISYHSLLAHTGAGDNRVYVLLDQNFTDHFGIVGSPDVHDLIRALLNGTVSGQPQVKTKFASPHDLPEIQEVS